jgi:ribonuclease P protein component
MPRFTKSERLTGVTKIDYLFSRGSSFLSHPFKVIWMAEDPTKQTVPVRILISVPKRQFQLATDRNLLRRRIREAFRLNKEILFEYLGVNNACISMAVIYIGREIKNYQELEEKIRKMLQLMIQQHEKNLH